MIAVISGMRVVRARVVRVAAPCWWVPCECWCYTRCAGVAAEVARLRLTAPGNSCTKRWRRRIIARRRSWAKMVMASSMSLKRDMSWARASWSTSGSTAPRVARACVPEGRVAERAVARLLWVLSSIVPAWPMGTPMNSTVPQIVPRAATRGEYLFRV